MIDLTPFLQAIIILATTVITFVFVPYIKSKSNNEKLIDIVEKSVKAAQQLAKKYDWVGEEKKRYVISRLEKNGYTINVDDLADPINALIEAVVYELKN